MFSLDAQRGRILPLSSPLPPDVEHLSVAVKRAQRKKQLRLLDSSQDFPSGTLDFGLVPGA